MNHTNFKVPFYKHIKIERACFSFSRERERKKRKRKTNKRTQHQQQWQKQHLKTYASEMMSENCWLMVNLFSIKKQNIERIMCTLKYCQNESIDSSISIGYRYRLCVCFNIWVLFVSQTMKSSAGKPNCLRWEAKGKKRSEYFTEFPIEWVINFR